MVAYGTATLFLDEKITDSKGPCGLIIDRSKESKPKAIQLFDKDVWKSANEGGRAETENGIETFEVKFEIELFEAMQYVTPRHRYHLFISKVRECLETGGEHSSN